MKGELVNGERVSGVLHRADTLDQVFALLKNAALDEVILLCESASATAIAPLLPRIRGVVCESGGATSHLAIISREFGIPCLMSTDTEGAPGLEGARITITPEGELEIHELAA
jgi:phosphohistidine swiveling domain-containing protein